MSSMTSRLSNRRSVRAARERSDPVGGCPENGDDKKTKIVTAKDQLSGNCKHNQKSQVILTPKFSIAITREFVKFFLPMMYHNRLPHHTI
uniref:Uncharacterized protein n=1 Tax=Panagrellus redivivus TaxID=6233 RepID=A0A7E4VEX9_PANRE